ncbi:MAG: SGNH/GDSL hydrolase family protein [Phycisphaeraceae bacterium]
MSDNQARYSLPHFLLLAFCLAMPFVTVTRADMQQDSPVTFPEQGALPAKHPLDVETWSETPEEEYYLIGTPRRSLEQIEQIRTEMPNGTFSAPRADWTHLSRTKRILNEGGELHLLALGDSIVLDTMRSGWLAKLQEAYPTAEIRGTAYVRGGGGCHHYKEEGRVAKHIVPRKPDVVFIGGISQKDISSIREVIHQLRDRLPNVEILLASGTFGHVDPRDADALAANDNYSGTGDWGEALQQLAEQENCAYLDMTTPWAEYIRSSELHPHLFYRDVIHANEYGEQILAKIMMAFWNPDTIEH